MLIKVHIFKGFFHHKNFISLKYSCKYLKWEIVQSIEDADIIFSGSKYIDVSKYPNKKFILAGQGNHNLEIPSNMKEVGLLNPKERKEYLKNAIAVISPSHYAEPFGLTAIEAGLSGTPIIFYGI